VNDYNAIIEALKQPPAYPERPGEIRHLQTHISHLFLTPEFVYKVKKPVDFGFLDFSTFEKRRFFCYEELTLNQRLSPDVYLQVVKIRRGPGGRISVEGTGEVVEHAVKMRRLPADCALDLLLAQNKVQTDQVQELGRMIGGFHLKAETNNEISGYGSPEGVAHNVVENFDQTAEYTGRTISPAKYQRVKAYSMAFLEQHRPLFERRAAGGRIRDCHGDLHGAQVFLTPDGVRIIDCIEFTKRFRYTDMVSDMAFMAMDLDHADRHDLSKLFVESWLDATGDREALDLLDFYKVYRAYVRGKVEGFRLADPHIPREEKEAATQRARAYFNLAYFYTQRSNSPRLIISAGLIGSGKSTIARHLATDSGMALVSSDVVRKRLAGVAPTERHYDGFGQGMYTPEFSERTYAEVFRLARQFLEEGKSVVLDATFGNRARREAAAAVAAGAGADFWAVECVATSEAVKERLRRRQQRANSVSDGRWEIYQQEKQQFQPIDEVPEGRHVVVQTSARPVFESVQYALTRLGLDPA